MGMGPCFRRRRMVKKPWQFDDVKRDTMWRVADCRLKWRLGDKDALKVNYRQPYLDTEQRWKQNWYIAIARLVFRMVFHNSSLLLHTRTLNGSFYDSLPSLHMGGWGWLLIGHDIWGCCSQVSWMELEFRVMLTRQLNLCCKMGINHSWWSLMSINQDIIGDVSPSIERLSLASPNQKHMILRMVGFTSNDIPFAVGFDLIWLDFAWPVYGWELRNVIKRRLLLVIWMLMSIWPNAWWLEKV